MSTTKHSTEARNQVRDLAAAIRDGRRSDSVPPGRPSSKHDAEPRRITGELPAVVASRGNR